MAARDTSQDKIDRNWQELLQELRVAQTAVQILTGFLLTLPFTPRFHELEDSRHAVYAVVLCAAVVATFLLMTPVALHRALFGHDARPWLVEAADRASRWGLAVLALANIGAVWLILDVVTTMWIAWVVALLVALFVVVVWVVVPARELKLAK
ncbi:DUF6328 family protein [Aeromicrobium sp. 9AM]|uniref:DUF6328 family protein n=1 Tax=Aeromicrobium sp. 9AM TaxID=2653126 RepID=UPI0012F3B51A|nr:DUF6328 family protein [Aeromicrobium sp. 9AM]VXC55487.1 conserved membrane hypothetical protein [Aeromicrobium sp. 9AM]